MTETRNAEPRNAAPRWLKPATDYGPLAVFLIAYALQGLMAATAALLAATLVALALALFYERRVPAMPLLTAGVVLVFGGLTLWLQDETFIKMKPTIINALFAVLLLGGLAFRQLWLRPLLGAALSLTEEGWRQLTLRFGLFFAAMAVLNEIVWRTQSTDVWVAFKVFGLLGLTFAFMFAQAPLLKRYRVEDGE
ncbi:MAG TPA: septation protein A [Ferrovibrio sp.]|jgi:intracellular septation protein|uniref:septation protein A n=1 Tax=Ferrovibrio sp. TaxID=1917215 RepID=UPI002B4ADB6D|nr:septation protein A [Ferrovibrio sp.]HLT77414.1 septation protein A [Ferrovibrio sp.]